MNAIAFGTKRAFHGFLRVSRKALVSLGLTAARFDMMHLLAGHPCGMLQSQLRRRLGVTAGVVSRMVRALEKLGWITRKKDCYVDRRQRWLELTASGRERIHQARRLLLRGVQRIVFDAICFGRGRARDERYLDMDLLEGYLHALRRDFGDTARVPYPWGHPDD
jgi:DNA-binding MarR family transcriptional regulator